MPDAQCPALLSNQNVGVDMEIEEYTLPAYWASYLINGDASGLEDGEQERIDAWLKAHGNPWCLGCSDESYFKHTFYDVGGELAGDALDYQFDVTKR